jgi:hypothetical protein
MSRTSTVCSLVTLALLLLARSSNAQHVLDMTAIPRKAPPSGVVEWDWLTLSEGHPSILVEVTLIDLDQRTLVERQSAHPLAEERRRHSVGAAMDTVEQRSRAFGASCDA